jgi:ribosome-associated protein
VQAIADEVELRLKAAGVPPAHVEGYKQGEWILVDYLDFVVHVFSEKARKFYDLERLWKTAKRLEPSELAPKPRAKAAPGTKAKVIKIKIKTKATKTKPAPRKPTAAAARRKKS